MIIIGSAKIDEHGKATGGKAGDQKQKTSPDYKGEVAMQNLKEYNYTDLHEFSGE